MSNRPGYRITEIGEIPEEWEVATLGGVAFPRSGGIRIGPFGSQLKKSELSQAGIKVYGQENVMSCNFLLGDRHISQQKYEDLKSFEILPGDVLVTMMGSLGFSVVVPAEAEKGIMDSHLLRIRLDQSMVLPQFVAILLRDSHIIRKQIRKLSQGAIMSGLNSKLVRSFQIPVPSLPEQQKIASILSTIDDAVQKTDEIIAKAQQLKKGLMQQLLTKGIGHTRFKRTEIGEIPEEWEVSELGELLSLEYGTGLTKSQRSAGEFPVYGSNGIVGYHNKALVDGPGIVIGRKGTVGAVTWSDPSFWPIDTTYYVKRRKRDMSLKWIYYELLHVELAKLNASTGVPGLNRNDAYMVRIALPSPPEQNKIASVLSEVDSKIANEKQRREELGQLKKGLMQVLLIGRVRVKVD